MYVYKDLLELAGLTTRLYTLLATLHNLPRPILPNDADQDTVALRAVDVGIPNGLRTCLETADMAGEVIVECRLLLSKGTHEAARYRLTGCG